MKTTQQTLAPFLSILFVFLFNSLLSQNLVPNHDFENYQNDFCGIQMANDFDNIMIDWTNPTMASPQVFFTTIDESCYNFQPNSTYPGPIGIKGDQLPHSGDVMIGLWSYTIDGLNQRQYAQIELSNAMTTGNSYVVEFYISLGDYMEFSIDKFGVYFSTDQPSSIDDGPLNLIPQVQVSDFIDEVDEWVLISDTIVASEDFSILTIGNFYNDENTNTMSNSTSSGEPGTYGAFYFIDDIRVEEVDRVGVETLERDDVSVYPTVFSNQITVDSKTNVNIEIYNSIGQNVYSGFSRSGSFEIETTEFVKGQYFVVVRFRTYTMTFVLIK